MLITSSVSTDGMMSKNASLSGAAEIGARQVCVSFGELEVLKDVEFGVRQGEVVGLIGPNGAGKTTLINVLTGYQPPVSGSVTLDDVDIGDWSPDRRVRAGLVRTFQAGRLFGALTCRENVLAAALATGLRPKQAEQTVVDLLESVDLLQWADIEAASLPYGYARLLSVARALATRPRFLLLDEPAAGMNEAEVPNFVALLKRLPGERGCGIGIIEHDMSVIMSTCERLVVLDHGVVIAGGTPDEIRVNPTVRKAYLGSEESASA